MPRYARSDLMTRFQAMVRARQPIFGAGAGTGISAKCEEAAGIDLIVVYNSGRYRMAGRASSAGLLAYGNANQIVVEMAGEVLPVTRSTPVIAGVNGTDPFIVMPVFLRQLRDLGFSGVQNFPTVGIIDGSFRTSLEETGINYATEVEMIGEAHAMDLLTTPYVFSAEEAVAMTEAGADFIVAHMGVTTGGTIGATTAKSLDHCVALIDEWAEAARRVRPDVIVIAHGGPISSPEDVAHVLKASRHCNGFYGASSMERLPTEVAIKAHVERFRRITY
ncbi:phosphoenolpyruvate hydrolase family protein [Piscinibacter sakaiensis]|uniref:TIM-barrel signal transduction protein n=1 Tax=Piscinibacter sakaiensis TaxID=1547922 RepID=A0A0K8P722_PISS1|nr:phosphoenolpyruvate hydrolase family protein [Piscinibacter sakaiensis]GAP38015.1 TIM-barrel signal transduction protein [Piscinibacter sakaiensis]